MNFISEKITLDHNRSAIKIKREKSWKFWISNLHTVKNNNNKKKSFQVESSESLRLSTGRLTGGPVADPRHREERCGALDLPRGDSPRWKPEWVWREAAYKGRTTAQRVKMDIWGHADSWEAFWIYIQHWSLKKIDFKTANEVLAGPSWARGKLEQPGSAFGQEVSRRGSQGRDGSAPTRGSSKARLICWDKHSLLS